MAELIKNVEHASIFTLKDLVEIEPGLRKQLYVVADAGLQNDSVRH